MGFRKSPNIVASGAMGMATGVAIAGGLLLVLSLPTHASVPTQATAQIETIEAAAVQPTHHQNI